MSLPRGCTRTLAIWTQVPHGREVRHFVAGTGIVLGLGRWLGYGTSTQVSFSQAEMFGLLLFLAGLALLLTTKQRLCVSGRISASFAVFAFALLTVAVWGNVAAPFYLLCTLSCFAEALSRRPCDD